MIKINAHGQQVVCHDQDQYQQVIYYDQDLDQW